MVKTIAVALKLSKGIQKGKKINDSQLLINQTITFLLTFVQVLTHGNSMTYFTLFGAMSCLDCIRFTLGLGFKCCILYVHMYIWHDSR